jgi:hypothetical protein
VVTLPLQQTETLARLQAMNRALGDYSETLRRRSASPDAFVPLEPMPGNSFDAKSTAPCWR